MTEAMCGKFGCMLPSGHDAFEEKVVWHWAISRGALKILMRLDEGGWPTRDLAAPEEDC